MKQPSERRKRILALHARAIRFSTDINQSYPTGVISPPSQVVWGQLVRAADGSSNNLVEADAASSHADFLNKMRIALREAKESKAEKGGPGGCLPPAAWRTGITARVDQL